MSRTFIIAEAGVNHNGAIDQAIALVDVAVECGADAVKFQTFIADNLVSKRVGKAEYQKRNSTIEETQYQMLKKLELGKKEHEVLISYCKTKGIQFMSTPFCVDSLELLANDFNLPVMKISSGDITNAPLLLRLAQLGKPVILSTGMSTLGDIEQALGVLAFGYLNWTHPRTLHNFQQAYQSEEGQEVLREKVTLLHCTTEYPTPFNEVNLRVLTNLKNTFNLQVGLSDHTQGISVPIAAVALGARVIEKHFTLDKEMSGPDHKASLEPNELKQMIISIREVEMALGSSIKLPTQSELKNKPIATKSLIAKCSIKKGEKFSANNITVKRPGTGISPMLYWDFLGKEANRDYAEDDVIQP